jgi:hypothetical protein
VINVIQGKRKSRDCLIKIRCWVSILRRRRLQVSFNRRRRGRLENTCRKKRRRVNLHRKRLSVRARLKNSTPSNLATRAQIEAVTRTEKSQTESWHLKLQSTGHRNPTGPILHLDDASILRMTRCILKTVLSLQPKQKSK